MSKITDYPLYADMQAALSDLQTLAADERDIAECFVKWRHHRQTTIESVARLQKELEGLVGRLDTAQVATAVSSVTVLVGSIIGNWKAQSLNGPKLLAILLCTGGPVILSRYIFKNELSGTTIDDIYYSLKKDQELTEPLKKWTHLSRIVDSSLEKHLQCSITSAAFPKILQVIGLCIEAVEGGAGARKDFKKDLQSSKLTNIEGLTQQAAEKLESFLERSVENPKILEPLKKIWKIFTETSHILDLARLSSVLCCQANKFLNSEVLSSLLNTAGLDSSHINSSTAFESVTVASNVVRIIIRDRNIEKRISEYSEALDNVKNALQEENRVIGYYID